MNPVQIIINGHQAELGGYLPQLIYSLDIKLLANVQIHQQQATLLKAWLNRLVDALKAEYVTYNNTLVKSSELRKF